MPFKDDILDAINLAWEDLAPDIFQANIDAIEAIFYDWDAGETLRVNGEIAGSPRNIVDTGELRDSQAITTEGENTYLLDWGVNYALPVHVGDPSRNYQARPWTQLAIAGDETADPDYQVPYAFLNIPDAFTQRFKAIAGL